MIDKYSIIIMDRQIILSNQEALKGLDLNLAYNAVKADKVSYEKCILDSQVKSITILVMDVCTTL